MGTQNHLSNTEASWTILDAYKDALTTTCLERHAALLDGEQSTTPGTLSYRVVRRDFKYGIIYNGHYVGEIGVIINPANKEMPVMALRNLLGSESPRATSAERAEHHRWQDDFCNALLARVKEIRIEWAQRGAQDTPDELTVYQAVQKTPKWNWGQILVIGGFIIALLTCLAAWLVVPQVQEGIQTVLDGGRTAWPTLVLPTVTP